MRSLGPRGLGFRVSGLELGLLDSRFRVRGFGPLTWRRFTEP